MGKTLGYGDKVLVYVDEKRKAVVKLTPNGILGFDKGFIKHSDIVGRRVGEVVELSRGVKALLLEPLPMDYVALRRRVTQVIYPKDASLMVYLAGVQPGSRVMEAGVGTGLLTVTLARLVGDNGVVYGFDVDQECLETTRRNLELTNLSHRVVLKLHDVRNPVELRDLDAVLYDLPDPWEALDTAWIALKVSGPIVIFVPTVNQIEKTVVAMRKKGFIDIHVYETLLREYEVREGAVRPHTRMVGHTGFIVFGRKIERK